jgi:hypothetical protein
MDTKPKPTPMRACQVASKFLRETEDRVRAGEVNKESVTVWLTQEEHDAIEVLRDFSAAKILGHK